jgi:hypothetical protein
MSSERITRQDLENARAAHESALHRFGMIDAGDRIDLDIGSKLYGRAFRLWLIKANQGSGQRESPVIGTGGFLGMTAREAFDRLTFATGVIYRTTDMLDRFPRQPIA